MLAVQTLDARPYHAPQRRVSRVEPRHSTLEDRLAQATVRKLESKEHVFCEGDPRLHVFRVEEGVIAIYKTLCDGRRRIIDFAYPGDLLGLGVLDEHILSAQAT